MNKLFYGDNLDILRRFIRDETVVLCYIEPPFYSKQNYNQIYNHTGVEDQVRDFRRRENELAVMEETGEKGTESKNGKSNKNV